MSRSFNVLYGTGLPVIDCIYTFCPSLLVKLPICNVCLAGVPVMYNVFH